MSVLSTARLKAIVFILAAIHGAASYAQMSSGSEMQFQGTLIDEPCTLAPDDTEIKLDFSTVADTYLYNNVRTRSQHFIIHLQNCNIDGWEGPGTVSVRFEGLPDTALPGYLATSGSSSGFGIGIEDRDGHLLDIGKDSVPVNLKDGNVPLMFGAFIQGEPAAIAQKSIVLGEFSATATFFLEYQ